MERRVKSLFAADSSRQSGTTYLLTVGRLLMSSLFLWDGVLQLQNPSGTARYFASVHVPFPQISILISITIHLLGGVAMLVGFQTRWAAFWLALLCLFTAFGVHLPLGDPENMVNFYKNLVMAGGFFYVITYGADGMSIDTALASAKRGRSKA